MIPRPLLGMIALFGALLGVTALFVFTGSGGHQATGLPSWPQADTLVGDRKSVV